MSFIVEAALAVSFEALFSKIASSNFKLVCSKQVYKEIEKWDKTLKIIYAVLADAEGKQMQNQAVKIWLADLKDLAYDVDDILDEFSTKALERKLMKEHHDQASTSKILKLLTFGSTFHPSTIMFNNQMMSKMRKITERLESLAAKKSEFQLSDQNDVKGVIPKKPETSSLVDETSIYGRRKDKEEILGMLLSNDDTVSVIPIVGMGGIGKTTLAQLVYNDDSIKDHFDLKAWVCVSNEFDVVNLTKKILSEVSRESCVENDLNALQNKLKERLSRKKFLLVLDDVWDEHYSKWDRLKRPFATGAPGSKVIVTTRNSKVSSLMSNDPDHHLLQKLSDDDALPILAHHALGARDFSGHPEFEVIGREILKKCDGLPLAIKTIGVLLRNKFSLEDWNRILVSQFWKPAEDESQIMPALWLSYYHLPSRLKQCFACCSLIPKDYEFEEEEIIPLWMAEGFLQDANTKGSMEDLGRQNFEELVSRSFFQATNKERSKFIMHDLINNLAQSVAQEFYFRMEEQHEVNISRRTRHLSYTASFWDGFKMFENVYEARQLRTFHSFWNPGHDGFSLSHNVVIDVMSKLRYVRVLSLKGYKIYEVPDIIRNLKYLRFLDFSYTEIKCLPDSVCNLYNLETLKLRGCEKISQLPLEMGNLINLCHLDIFGACSIQKLPSGIGKLTNLQVLSNFIVGQGDAANIREMKDLSGLKGKLSISGLQNVNDDRDAFEAKMSKKTGLSDLKLEWCDDSDENLRNKEVEGDVLRLLEPHKELKSLIISYYAGLTFPVWIAVPSFENLQSLTLEGCRNCKSLPAVGKLPLLKDLCIKGMNGITSVGNEFYGENLISTFPSLESLHFEDMAEWEEWKACEVDEQGKIFHCLRELHIRNCPKLVEVSSVNGFCSLEELQIYECKELEVSISNLPKLNALKIDGCKEVVFGSYNDRCSVKEVLLSNISKETVKSESMMVESLNVDASWLAPLEPSALKRKGCPDMAPLELPSDLEIKGCPDMAPFESPPELEIKGRPDMAPLESPPDLEIKGRPDMAPLESPPDLKIKGRPDIVSVGTTKIKEKEKEGHLQYNIPCTIEHLKIANCEGFEKISRSFQNLRCLGQLKIKKCGKLVSVETNSLPATLKYLEIDNCENVQCLLDDGEDMNFSSTSLLQSLRVKECKALKSLSSSRKLPTCLESLYVYGCSELEFVAQEIRDEARLESIYISDCEKIKYLPQGLDKLSSLHSVSIRDCPQLECLPQSGLPSYTNLKSMILSGCEKLQALPQLKSLDRLQDLRVRECPRLKSIFSEGSFGLPTNLRELEVDDPDMIKAVMEWGLHRLTSLQHLTICDSNSFPQERDEIEMKLPTSLTHLHIFSFKNLRKISPNTFQNLTSLRTLIISNCPKLKSLPKEKLLPSLMRLYIEGCPELKKRCQRDKGKLWSNIAHIPFVEIDRENIYA